MEILEVISKHKRNKRSPNMRGLWHTKIGMAECIVEKDGMLVTRHIELPEKEVKKNEKNDK